MCDDSETWARNFVLFATYGRLPSYCFFSGCDTFDTAERLEWWRQFYSSTDPRVAYLARRWIGASVAHPSETKVFARLDTA